MNDLPKSVYHYTKTSVLKQIVQNQEFRLSNVFFMNDHLEVNWLFRLASLMASWQWKTCDFRRPRSTALLRCCSMP
jgi:hypothetical protein